MRREKYEIRAEWKEWLSEFEWAQGMTGEEVKKVEDRVLGKDGGAE